MFLALQSAAAGLRSSANRVAIAAQDVVVAAQSQSSSIGADSGNLSRGNAAYQLAAQGGSPSLRLPSSGWHAGSPSFANVAANFQNPPASLEEGIINLKMAAQAYKANAAVFKSVNKTMGALLAIKT